MDYKTFFLTLLYESFCLFHPSVAINAVVIQPKAPAEGYLIALLPYTDKDPINVIIVNLSPFTYFASLFGNTNIINPVIVPNTNPMQIPMGPCNN